MQKGDIEQAVFVDPKVENKMAREGKPMPAPKKGEDHDTHIAEHTKDIKVNGMNEQILEHIAETMMLKQEEQPPPVPEMPPAPGAAPGGVSGAPQGPAGPMQPA
jgi:hypothetical protein